MAKKVRKNHKKPKLKLILGIIGALIFLSGTILLVLVLQNRTQLESEAAAPKYQIWVQASNRGTHGGMQPDFLEQFTQPERWAKARSHVDVYQFHVYSLSEKNGVTDQFLKDYIVPTLNRDNIVISLNALGANWAQCGAREQVMYDEAAVIDRIHAAGGKVGYLNLQSTYSKDLDTIGHSCDPYPDAKRTQDIARYVRYMKAKYPGIKVGITDADTIEDRRKFMANVASNLRKQGLGLDFYIYDNLGGKMHTKNGSPDAIFDIEKYSKQNLHLPFGIIVTSGKSARSNKAFHELSMSALRKYINFGGRPQIYLITSWYHFPTHLLPDNSSKAFTIMKTTNEAGVFLKKNATKSPKKNTNQKKKPPKRK